jgi:hypothetical protein
MNTGILAIGQTGMVSFILAAPPVKSNGAAERTNLAAFL